MAPYTKSEARAWAREKLVGVINCTIPSFTTDLERINETAVRHDVALAKATASSVPWPSPRSPSPCRST